MNIAADLTLTRNQLIQLGILLSNRIHDLDVHMATCDYEARFPVRNPHLPPLAETARREDQNYRNDLSALYAIIDAATDRTSVNAHNTI